MELKIFVLVPVYNVEKYLEECLESILSQNYSNYEVILVDDGSKDSSGEICDRYAEKHLNISVIHKENGGQLSARLAAVDFIKKYRATDASYCIFVDSDDLLKTGALAAIAESIEKTGCDMLIYGFEKFKNNGEVFFTAGNNVNEIQITAEEDIFKLLLSDSIYNSMCRKAFQTELLNNDFSAVSDVRIGEDFMQTAIIAQKCKRLALIPKVLYGYRENSESITHRKDIKKYTDDLTSKEFVINEIQKKNILDEKEISAYRLRCIEYLEKQIKFILSQNDRCTAVGYLKAVYEHSFYQNFLKIGVTEKSGLIMKLFNKQKYITAYRLYRINAFKNRLLRRG